jgi:hypothetical protein
MKVEEYAEHLIRVIRYETRQGRYATAQILASQLAEILQGMTETQDKKRKDEATVRALSLVRKVEIGGAQVIA